jgi:hypothetical protein
MEIAEQLFLKSLFLRRRFGKDKMKELAIDIDCLIAKRTTSDFHQSKVVEDAAKAVEELHKRGFKIVVFSLNFLGDSQVARKWLAEKGIRFDEFLLFKPKCTLIIDDKAVKLDGWRGILEALT